MGDMKRRFAELQLTPAQQQKVDAILADLRPKMAALRDLPPEERAKARERALADLRARIGDQLTAEQKAKYQAMQAEAGGRQATRGRIYVVDEGKPRAVNVRLGITDGTMTELLAGAGGADASRLVEGADVVVGTVNPSATTPARPAGPRMGF
jgi:HlyD family secretion protein